mgnify:CR=1 FL=1
MSWFSVGAWLLVSVTMQVVVDERGMVENPIYRPIRAILAHSVLFSEQGYSEDIAAFKVGTESQFGQPKPYGFRTTTNFPTFSAPSTRSV